MGEFGRSSLRATLCGALFVVAACGSQTPLEQAVHRIESGQLIEELNRRQSEKGAQLTGITPLSYETRIEVPASDPCATAVNPPEGSSEETFNEAMKSVAICMRDTLKPYNLRLRAFSYLKQFKRTNDVAPLHELDDRALEEYLDRRQEDSFFLSSTLAPEVRDRVRNEYSGSDLEEMVNLSRSAREAMAVAAGKVFAMMDARPALFAHFLKLDRYAVLKALRENVADAEGLETAKAVLKAMNQVPPPELGPSTFPVHLLHPYGVFSVVPDEGDELSPLHPAENPLLQSAFRMTQLEGDDSYVQERVQEYLQLKTFDNPPTTPHEPPAENAVRVVLMDTGIDYKTFSDLELFLGTGENGQIGSRDFADGDDNPFLPALGMYYSHGTATLASLMTIVAHHAPRVLKERRIDVGMWKLSTIRGVLAGTEEAAAVWESRPGSLFDALVENADGDQVKPDVISVSLGFESKQVLAEVIKRPQLLKKTSGLWVMAAGNSGVDLLNVPEGVPSGPHSCFLDVPAADRPVDRILCVGALERGIVNDQIAGYSNYGEWVDVYAYESYIKHCPSGTSCSTPAVAAVAATLKALFPQMTPEQIKKAIIASSVPRTLSVGWNPTSLEDMIRSTMGGAMKTRTVRVFDPMTMMKKVIEYAKKNTIP